MTTRSKRAWAALRVTSVTDPVLRVTAATARNPPPPGRTTGRVTGPPPGPVTGGALPVPTPPRLRFHLVTPDPGAGPTATKGPGDP
ncbi:hypothetical protein ACFPM0_22210 [Pseudonocardia sulfidoxydans]|uniref:hypothetical protein n=1 Tax=Pseudonocardia sulfidoxydans TaxID=54011 RepID=UPI00360D5313